MNCELFYDSVFDYIFDADVVSLYPIGKEINTNIYRTDTLGIYKITYKAPKNLFNPILPRK